MFLAPHGAVLFLLMLSTALLGYTAENGRQSVKKQPQVLQSGDNAGEAEDWVTAGALGIALQVLQILPASASYTFSTPTVGRAVGG